MTTNNSVQKATIKMLQVNQNGILKNAKIIHMRMGKDRKKEKTERIN